MDRAALITAIATREGTAKQIAKWYDVTVTELREFVEKNREAIEMAKEAIDIAEVEPTALNELTPKDLDELWITQKASRLHRYEVIADSLFEQIQSGQSSGSDLSTVLREFRSYLMAAANELGQLLHRGSGENSMGDTMGVDIQGVNIENLR